MLLRTTLTLTALIFTVLIVTAIAAPTPHRRPQGESAEPAQENRADTEQEEEDSSALALAGKASTAVRAGQLEKALALLDEAVETSPKSKRILSLRATVRSRAGDYAGAVEDYDTLIELGEAMFDPRGDAYLKLGRIEKAIADYDRAIEEQPQLEPHHWRRGIAYYYAGEFVKGQKQFEGYQAVDSSDVENAAWRYFCMARELGVERARADILEVGFDPRVPMAQIYDLCAGELEPKDVLKAAQSGDPSPEELNQRLFYAHLYLGLYYEAEKDPERTKQHLEIATKKHRIGHFMWDVARIHHERLTKQDER